MSRSHSGAHGTKTRIKPRDFRVPPGKKVDLSSWPTAVRPICASKKEYEALLARQMEDLSSQRDQLGQLPHVVAEPRGHRGCDAKGLVHAAEVVCMKCSATAAAWFRACRRSVHDQRPRVAAC